MNWWKDESKCGGNFYFGCIKEINKETGDVLVAYEDGDLEWESPHTNKGFVYNPMSLPKYPLNAVFFKVRTITNCMTQLMSIVPLTVVAVYRCIRSFCWQDNKV